MAGTHTLSGDILTLIGGEDFERLRAYVSMDQERLVDPDDTTKNRVGDIDVILWGENTTSITVDLPDETWLPAPHWFRLHVEYRSLTHGVNKVWVSNEFEMTADRTVGSIPTDMPRAISEADYESLIGARDDAADSATAAEASAAIATAIVAADAVPAVPTGRGAAARRYKRVAVLDGVGDTTGASISGVLSGNGDLGVPMFTDIEIRARQRYANQFTISAQLTGHTDTTSGTEIFYRQVSAYVYEIWARRPIFDAAVRFNVLGFDGNAGAVMDTEQTTAPSGLVPVTLSTLSATLDAATAAAIVNPLLTDRLALVGSFDRGASVAKARLDYEDQAGFDEEWASLAGWAQGGVQLSAGRVYADTADGAGTNGGKKALALLSGRSRILGSFTVDGTTGSRSCYIGVNKSGNETVSAAQIITGGIAFCIGVDGTMRPVSVLGGVTTAAASPAPAAIPTGTYYVAATLDDTQITLTCFNADASIIWSRSTTRASFGTPTHVMFWITDSRGLSGNSMGPIGATAGGSTRITLKPRGTVEGAANKWNHFETLPGGGLATLGVPAAYDSRKPLPLIIFCHGSGENFYSITKQSDATKMGLLTQNLLSDGYAVLSGENGGLQNWGNETALDAVLDQYRWFRDRYALGPVVMLGSSMGNLACGLTIARREIPNIVGWYGIDPVLSLSAVFADVQHRSKIITAYGIAGDGSDYAAKTAGHDPMLFDAADFRGIPVRFAASPDDTVVLESQNTTPMLAKLAGTAAEASLFPRTGSHVATSHFNLADLRSFLARVTAA